MTAQSQKTEQKRLHSCVLSPPKWPKIPEKLEKRACGTVKISDFVSDTAFRIANVRENGQTHHNTTLLGKYRVRKLTEKVDLQELDGTVCTASRTK